MKKLITEEDDMNTEINPSSNLPLAPEHWNDPQVQPAFQPCRACGYCGPAQVRDAITTAGWVMFIVLTCSCIGTLFCWVPLITMTDRRMHCAGCGVLL